MRSRRLVSEFDAGLVIVGLPLSLSGQLGPAAKATVAEASALEAQLEVPVVLHDERLTTVEADRLLRFASDPALSQVERDVPGHAKPAGRV